MKEPIARQPIARVEDVTADVDAPPITAEGNGTCNTTVTDKYGTVHWQGVVGTKGMSREQRKEYRAALDAATAANERFAVEHPDSVNGTAPTTTELAEQARAKRVKREKDPLADASADARYGPLREIVKRDADGLYAKLTLSCGHVVKFKAARADRKNTRCRKCRASTPAPVTAVKREPVPRDDAEPEPATKRQPIARDPVARIEEFVARGVAAQAAVDAVIVRVKEDAPVLPIPSRVQPRTTPPRGPKRTKPTRPKRAARTPTTKRRTKGHDSSTASRSHRARARGAAKSRGQARRRQR